MRVISGSARGRRIKAPEGDVRPTGDKIKASIFSQLEALAYKRGFEPSEEDPEERSALALAWPRVLDLYAGSGALGIEALSRGAASVDFVERDARARKTIEANLRGTDLREGGVIYPLPAERAVSTLTGAYDLILADPPYADLEAERVLSAVAASPLVADRTVLVWEHASDRSVPSVLGSLRLMRTRRHGATAISLYVGDVESARSSSELMEGAGTE